MMGHNVILVSSGSIPIGRMVLHRQHLLSGSMQVGPSLLSLSVRGL